MTSQVTGDWAPPEAREEDRLRVEPVIPSLGPLGWLAVLLIAVLLTVLAHAGSVHPDQREHPEPSLLTDPAYVIAKSAE